jgi:hypothetical protein
MILLLPITNILKNSFSRKVLFFSYETAELWNLGVQNDRICCLVVRVLGYRSGGPGSIPGTIRKGKVVGLERDSLSLISTIEELLDRKVAAPVYKTDNTAVEIRHADHVAPSIRKSWQLLRRQAAVARSV